MNIIIMLVVVVLVAILFGKKENELADLKFSMLVNSVESLKSLTKYLGKITDLRIILSKQKRELEEATAERYELRIKAKKLGEMADTFEKEIDIKAKELFKLRRDLEISENNYKEVRKDFYEAMGGIKQFIAEVKKYKSKIKKLEGLLDKAQIAIAFSEKKFQELRTRNIDMSNTLKTYQEENAKRISRDLKRKNICKRK